jgi:hypothetical protein
MVNNTYGIAAVHPPFLDHMMSELNSEKNGCLKQIADCHKLRQSPKQKAVCSDAEWMCRFSVLDTD